MDDDERHERFSELLRKYANDPARAALNEEIVKRVRAEHPGIHDAELEWAWREAIVALGLDEPKSRRQCRWCSKLARPKDEFCSQECEHAQLAEWTEPWDDS